MLSPMHWPAFTYPWWREYRLRLIVVFAALVLIPLTCAALAVIIVVRPAQHPPVPGHTPTPSANPSRSAATGLCPDDAFLLFPAAYSPEQIRVACGVESLCQRAHTGKEQTVVVIDSYASPTLQQDNETSRSGEPVLGGAVERFLGVGHSNDQRVVARLLCVWLVVFF